jgi:hypothetical protein
MGCIYYTRQHIGSHAGGADRRPQRSPQVRYGSISPFSIADDGIRLDGHDVRTD